MFPVKKQPTKHQRTKELEIRKQSCLTVVNHYLKVANLRVTLHRQVISATVVTNCTENEIQYLAKKRGSKYQNPREPELGKAR